MPVYKLHYFNTRSRGETPRQLFAYGNIEYEDIRIEVNEWDKIKQKMPFGKVPVLEVDGKMIPQTGAINRLLAKQVGLYGNDDMECADIDVIIEMCSEIWKFLPRIYKENDPVKRAAAVKEVTEELLPPYLDKLESYLDGDKVFLVGGRMTLADLYFVNDILWPRDFGVTINLDKYPKLKALEKAVTSEPKIAAWIAKRPVTQT